MTTLALRRAARERRDLRTRPDATAFARLCADIARRLAAACATMPSAEFDALVRDMARVQLRWEERRWRATLPATALRVVLRHQPPRASRARWAASR